MIRLLRARPHTWNNAILTFWTFIAVVNASLLFIWPDLDHAVSSTTVRLAIVATFLALPAVELFKRRDTLKEKEAGKDA